MKLGKENIKTGMKKLAVSAGLFFMNLRMTTAYAGGIASNKLFTGTKQLFTDLKTPLIGMSAAIAVVIIIYFLIRMKMAEEMDAKMYKKRIFTVIACCIGIVLVSSLLTAILSYYK